MLMDIAVLHAATVQRCVGHTSTYLQRIMRYMETTPEVPNNLLVLVNVL